MTRTLRIGSGSAWWGDRVSPAQLNAERGNLDYLCFETMAEATVSAAQVRARRDPSFPGYDTYLDDRMRAVLSACMQRGTRIISNQGWINPEAAAARIAELLRECGHHAVKVAAIGGSLVTERAMQLTDAIMETGESTSTLAGTLISAEVYLGAEPIVEALDAGAQIVVTGRVADPSIFLAPDDAPEPYEIAVRVAARTRTREEALKVGREVDGMAVSGVAHTGKRVPHQERTREVVGVWSSLVSRELIAPSITWEES